MDRRRSKRLKLQAAVAEECRQPVTPPVPTMEPEPEQPRRILRLRIWRARGSLVSTADDAAAAALAAGGQVEGVPTMDAEVWRKLPEEVLWDVVRFLPAAKLFQLHSVSPEWRRMLTSTNFRKRMAATESEEPRVVAGLQVIEEDGDNSSSSSSQQVDASMQVIIVVQDINLSAFVPASFWSTYSKSYYSVVAAADGLVCISNDSELEHIKQHEECNLDPEDLLAAPWANRYCVINPLTRTCVVLPQLPFWPARWLPPTATAVTIYSLDWYKKEVQVATYDLATGGGGVWVVAGHKCGSLRHAEHLRLGALLTLCTAGDNKDWWCHEDDRVLEAAVAGRVAEPSVAALGLDRAAFHPCRYDDVWPWTKLLAHRGAVYCVARPVRRRGERKVKPDDHVVCCVWRLRRPAMVAWEPVARLLLREVQRLTGFRHLNNPANCWVQGVHGVGEWLCCQLMVYKYSGWREPTSGGEPWSVKEQWMVLLLLHVGTGEWKLLQVQHAQHTLNADGRYQHRYSHLDILQLKCARALELRPDVFLS